MLAGLASGVIASVRDLRAVTDRIEAEFAPDPARHEDYRLSGERFARLVAVGRSAEVSRRDSATAPATPTATARPAAP